MSSTRKTLALLSYFSEARPEIGLTQMCKLAGRDKATTYRHLQSLEFAGFVEQNPMTKQYRLGPTIMQLAQVREATVPRKAGAQMALQDLAESTEETAHVSVLSGDTMYALASCESPRHATRAIIDITTFPLHATASGLCALAFGPDVLMEKAMADLAAFTDNTPTSPDNLNGLVATARVTGFARSDRGYEDEIHSLSAPLFDQTGLFVGAVSVASVATRFDASSEEKIKTGLVMASRSITRNWGGAIPANIEAAWAASLTHSDTLDTAS